MLLNLLDLFHESLKQETSSEVKFHEKPYQIPQSSDKKEEEIFLDYLRLMDGNSMIKTVFQGIYKSQISCSFCKKTSMSFDPFTICSLPILKKSTKILRLEFYLEKSKPNFNAYKFSLNFNKQNKFTIGNLKTLLKKKLNLNSSDLIAKNANSDKENAILTDDILLQSLIEQHPLKLLIRQLMDFELKIFKSNKILAHITFKTTSEFSNRVFIFREYNTFLFLDKNETLEIIHYHIFLYLNELNFIDVSINSANFSEKISELPYIIKISNNNERNGLDQQKTESSDLIFSKTVSLKDFIFSHKKGTDQAFSLDIELINNSYCPKFIKPKEETIKINEENIKDTNIFDCLDLMTMEENMDESNKWFCSNCKVNQMSTKKLEIYQTGPILIINFKRNKFSPIKKKITTKIDFPLNELNLKEYIISDKKIKIFDLFAVCNHYGDAFQGHYTAFCKNNALNEKWFCYDDERVQIIESSENIITQNAYILFYKRRE